MAAWLVSLIGITATLVGIVLGFVLNMWNDNRKWDRESKIRYHQQRIEAYSSYLRALNLVTAATAAGREMNTISDSGVVQSNLQVFSKTYGDSSFR